MVKRTSKPISTISYNSIGFLKVILNQLLTNQNIVFYAFVPHKGEMDISTGEEEKEHIHLYIEPCGTIDLMSLREKFLEPDLLHPETPLGVMPFRVSNSYYDWYWYSLHDRQYLELKGLERQYHYSFGDLVLSDSNYSHMLLENRPRPVSISESIRQSINEGKSDIEVAMEQKSDLRFLANSVKGVQLMREYVQGRKIEEDNEKDMEEVAKQLGF